MTISSRAAGGSVSSWVGRLVATPGIDAATALWLRISVANLVLAGSTRSQALATLRIEAETLPGVVGCSRLRAIDAALDDLVAR